MRRRNAILLYIGVIAVPTFVLLFFGIQSFERQRQAVATLIRSNLRLSGERIATEIERRTSQMAEACLREAERTDRSRAQMESVRAKHPVARYIFISQGDRVLYPPLHTAPPHALEDLLANEAQPARTQYADIFYEAEDQELRRENCSAALVSYQKAAEVAVSARLKALASFRVARCLEKSDRPTEAKEAYEALARAYPDLNDLAHRPYALVSAVALKPVTSVDPELWRDAVRGRWPLSAEQMDYFASRIGNGVAPPADSYAAHLDFARAVEAYFRPGGALRSDEVYTFAFRAKDSSHQLFYTAIAAGRTETVVLGLAVDSDWVKDRLLPRWRAELELTENVSIVARDTAPADTSEARIGFPSLFPFWALSVRSMPGAPERTGLLVQAATTVLVLTLLLIGVLLILRDLSREARMNQLRSDFVGAVSHELKTPITLIRLYGETLLEDENFPPQQRREFHEVITRESERLTQLIDKVLSFSKIERGEKQYRLQAGDLAPVVSQTIEAYEPYLKRRGFSVETQLASELPAVRFDRDAVSQALVNLVDNAQKYSGEIKQVAIRSYVRDGSVVIEVEDRGIGIATAEREKIFQRFYRVKNAVAKGGYGLGLFLVRHIMEAHGGTVELESEIGRGSRFGLVFPRICEAS